MAGLRIGQGGLFLGQRLAEVGLGQGGGDGGPEVQCFFRTNAGGILRKMGLVGMVFQRRQRGDCVFQRGGVQES